MPRPLRSVPVLVAGVLAALGVPPGRGGLLSVEEALGEAPPSATEFKVTVAPGEVERVMRELGLTARAPERREVWFYDTRSLDLFHRGIILRARKVKHGADDSTVKLRPLAAAAVAPAWFSRDGFKCEIDVVGSRGTESCSLTVPQRRGEIDDVNAGRRDLRKLFSGDQERFLETHAPGHTALGALKALGPVQARVWKVEPGRRRPGFTAERWELPDGRVLLELSVRASAPEATAERAAFRDLLAHHGIDASDEQETKTRVALEYFAGR